MDQTPLFTPPSLHACVRCKVTMPPSVQLGWFGDDPKTASTSTGFDLAAEVEAIGPEDSRH
jgi:hypothetical protein